MKPTESPVYYRLRGELEDEDVSFDLTGGEHRVGSSPSSDFRLRVTGVSRQHALLTVTAEGVVVEDCGSKNGTFVNESRVDRASVPIGATVTFGPAQLRLELVESEDIELALAVEGTDADVASQLSSETAPFYDAVEPAVAASWLRLLVGFSEQLFATPRGEPTAALGYLVRSLGISASCLVEWTDDGEAVVMASYGPLGELGPPPEPAAQRTLVAQKTLAFQTDEALSRGTFADREHPRLELYLWGDFQGRSGSRALFRFLLTLLDRIRAWELQAPPARRIAGQTPDAHPELDFPEDYLPAVSPSMTALYRQLRAIVRADLPVLITGETGVGKERLAEVLHRSSERSAGPFLPINCAAIPADLLEAELFGIGRGVATGVEARTGKFQAAEGGTIFLDEIGEMQPALQAKFLRVLQEKEVQPVGAAPVKVDVRIVAATNADLAERMDQGRFRRDLYYRLAGFEVAVPPLRLCTDDIPHLIEYFLRRFAGERGIYVRGITVKAYRRLLTYAWPGNTRELRHEIRRLVYLCSEGDVIDSGKLSPRLTAEKIAADTADRVTGDSVAGDLARDGDIRIEPRVRELERQLICEALRRCAGRQTRAAPLLGISRNGLGEKIKRLGIDPQAFRPELREP